MWLAVGLVVIVGGVIALWAMSQKPSAPATTELTTEQQNTSANIESAVNQSSQTGTSQPAEPKTYSTHPSIRAYLQGPTEIAANTVWEGLVVIPQNTVGVAGAPDVMWGDGSADPEWGGSPWQYDNAGSASITHTYTKPGNYTITVYINGGAGVGFEQGTVIIKKTVTVR